MTDKLPKGAVEAATEISLRIHNVWNLHLSDEEVEFFATIIAAKVRPMVEALGSLYDSLMEDGKPPFVGDGDERVYQLIGGKMSTSLDTIRATIQAWRGEP